MEYSEMDTDSEREAREIAVESLYLLQSSGPYNAGLLQFENSDRVALCVTSGVGTLSGHQIINRSKKSIRFEHFCVATFEASEVNGLMCGKMFPCVKIYRNSEVVNGSDVMISSQDLNGSDHNRKFDPSWGRAHVTLPGFELRKYNNTIVIYTKNAAGNLEFVTYAWLFISPRRICLYVLNGDEMPVLIEHYGPFIAYS